MNIVYIDVLVILNIYVTYFLLRATALFLHERISGKRYAAGTILGGISSLVILLPSIHYSATVLIKIISGFLIVAAVFSVKDIYRFLKYSLTFIIINMVFAGLMLLLWLFSAPLGMVYNNGAAYFDISFSAILISTAVAYGLIRLVRYWLDSRLSTEQSYLIEVTYKGSKIELPAFADSGNTVADFFSGLSVIICRGDKFKGILPAEILSYSGREEPVEVKGFRLLPYSTVGHTGIMPVFIPDNIAVKVNGTEKNVAAMIGIAQNSFIDINIDAIFNPKIIK